MYSAEILLRYRKLSEAKSLFQKSFEYFSGNSSPLSNDVIYFHERVALTQTYLGLDSEADEAYRSLLGRYPSAHQTISSNLGFIARRLRNFANAKRYYEDALEKSEYRSNDPFVRSGLAISLRELGGSAEDDASVWPHLIQYVDVNSTLSETRHVKPPFSAEVFYFAIARNLESLLSLWAIPLESDHIPRLLATVNGDPLSCSFRERTSLFVRLDSS